MEKGYSYNSSDMITYLKGIPNKYYATLNILFLKDQTYNLLVHEDGCGAVNMGSMMTYISDGSDCPYDYIKYTILHELGHSLDSMYYKIKGVYLSNSNDVKKAINTYSKNKQTSYMRVYSYTNLSEFYADLFAINYLNNSDFKNSYKNKWLLDDNLKKIINSSNNKSNIIFNNYNYDWHKYKNMYRNVK